jgi:hypothetical protein
MSDGVSQGTANAVATPAASDRCPRCGDGFHCGANDATPCPCTGLTVPADVQARLRTRYSGCLCLRCLAELAAAGRDTED